MLGWFEAEALVPNSISPSNGPARNGADTRFPQNRERTTRRVTTPKPKPRRQDPIDVLPLEVFSLLFSFLPLPPTAIARSSFVSHSWRTSNLSTPSLHTE